jgi:hypothetical protein
MLNLLFNLIRLIIIISLNNLLIIVYDVLHKKKKKLNQNKEIKGKKYEK